MSQDKNTLSLASKLAAIGKEIGAVDKSGRNTQQNYAYIEYGVVAGRIRELFDKYHIIIIPNVDNVIQDEITNKYGNKGYHYILNMTFTLINGDDVEDQEIASWAGEASDYGDKGINKAETSGTKYFLMRLFNISEKGDDNDGNTPDEITETKKKSKFSDQEIATAKLKLGSCGDLETLKNTYQGLGDISKDAEIIKYTNVMKASLQNE